MPWWWYYLFDPAVLYWITNFTGTEGNDTIDGSVFNDTIWALGGEDRLSGHNGNDWINAGTGDDVVYGGNGNDTVYGEAGADFLVGEAGHDTMFGGGHDDVLIGGEGNDELHGGAGNDGTDLLSGSFGGIWGQAGNDLIYGDDGNDMLLGGTGDDTVYGGEGNDQIQEGPESSEPSGQDRFYGGGGDDTIEVGGMGDALNNLVMDGGDGFDTLSFFVSDQVISHIGMLAANTQNIEAISLTLAYHTLLIINPTDVLDFSADNTLFVTRHVDPGAPTPLDSQVISDHSDGHIWNPAGTIAAYGTFFNGYHTMVDGQYVQLYVEQTLPQGGLLV